MTIRDTIKRYFEQGDFPTQAQFYELFDGIFFKDEGLSRTESTGVSVLSFPAGTWIDKIGIVSPGAIVVSCGTVDGGNDVIDNENVSGTEGFNKDVYFPSDGALYFSGITSNTKIIIFTR